MTIGSESNASNETAAAAPKPRARRGRRASGFTLIEVLATLVIIAIVLPVAMQGISIATNAASDSRRRVEAAALGESRLAEFIATLEWQNGGGGGDFGEDWPDYRWTADVYDWSETNMKEIDMRVIWKGRSGQDKSIILTTLIYDNGTADSSLGTGF